jgi:hypothetical protein
MTGVLFWASAIVPSIAVLGAFFPDWMFCIAGAVLLMVIVHYALRATGLTRGPGRRGWLLVYLALGTIFALSFWLAFFQN